MCRGAFQVFKRVARSPVVQRVLALENTPLARVADRKLDLDLQVAEEVYTNLSDHFSQMLSGRDTESIKMRDLFLRGMVSETTSVKVLRRLSKDWHVHIKTLRDAAKPRDRANRFTLRKLMCGPNKLDLMLCSAPLSLIC